MEADKKAILKKILAISGACDNQPVKKCGKSAELG